MSQWGPPDDCCSVYGFTPQLIILPQYWFLQQFFWSFVMHVAWWVIVLWQKANTLHTHCFGWTLIMLLQRKGVGSNWSLPPNFRQHQKWPILSCGSGINRQMLYKKAQNENKGNIKRHSCGKNRDWKGRHL